MPNIVLAAANPSIRAAFDLEDNAPIPLRFLGTSQADPGARATGLCYELFRDNPNHPSLRFDSRKTVKARLKALLARAA